MKKITRILIICAVILVAVLAFTACSEKTKQAAIDTDVSGKTVSGNGGMAVKYGDYVYFVNGNAESTADNTFGNVVKGAIYRTTLKNGEPDYTTLERIVPKVVYGTDKNYGGIYIIDDYIYYQSTSVDKNSKGEYKTDKGVFMRTSIDGSKTETLLDFDDNATIIYTSDDCKYFAYVENNRIYSFGTENKKSELLSVPNGKESTDSTKQAVAYKFVDSYVFFTMYNRADEANFSKDYIVWAFDLKTGKLSKLMSSADFGKDVLFTVNIIDAIVNKDGFTLYYTKSGSTTDVYNGFYAQTFASADPKFNKDTEIRYSITNNSTYTSFDKLGNGYVLAFTGTGFDVFTSEVENGLVKKLIGEDDLPVKLLSDNSTSITVLDIVETADEVALFYVVDDAFTYEKLFDKVAGENATVYTVADGNVVKYFSAKYCSGHVSYDIMDGIIYYVSEDLDDNACYYVIPDIKKLANGEIEVDIAKGKVLGKITDEDTQTLLQK